MHSCHTLTVYNMYGVVCGISLIIGCFAQQNVPTPNLNSLGDNGLTDLPASVNGGLPQLPNGVPNLPSSPAIPITTGKSIIF